ncbi:hypothetical protein IB643_04460 [Allofrancisella guangzhouensis]|uniref:hypothetical protein n=1 Tax=Allofrancisella guangzhouensis TaxID=594679 RepID=UPI001902D39B|nr:hypothetical protein [Allofrancisella guangzhouensis]MBK2027404.1 hypothetical protein [Allofrancisella guangzhouensis]
MVDAVINNKNETMLLDEFVNSGLCMGMKDTDKDEIIAYLVKDNPSVKPYSFEILENKKINVYLNNKIYMEEISKYDLLKKRDVINSTDDLTYEKILQIKDSKAKIIIE